MKTARFRVVLGALNLKEFSPLLKVFRHLWVQASCPLTVVPTVSSFCTGSPYCCRLVKALMERQNNLSYLDPRADSDIDLRCVS